MSTAINSAWQCHAGAAYVYPSGPASFFHLAVILNDPVPFPQKGRRPCVCVVHFTTINAGIYYDKTCVFQPGPGVHPFISHACYAYYSKAEDLFADDVESNVNSKVWRDKPPDFSDAEVQRLKVGLQNSPHTPQRLLNLPI
jgi:hypothetical protein